MVFTNREVPLYVHVHVCMYMYMYMYVTILWRHCYHKPFKYGHLLNYIVLTVSYKLQWYLFSQSMCVISSYMYMCIFIISLLWIIFKYKIIETLTIWNTCSQHYDVLFWISVWSVVYDVALFLKYILSDHACSCLNGRLSGCFLNCWTCMYMYMYMHYCIG